MDDLISNELSAKYGSIDEGSQSRYQRSEADNLKEQTLLKYIMDYFTSHHSKAMDPASNQVRQYVSNLKARIKRVSYNFDNIMLML